MMDIFLITTFGGVAAILIGALTIWAINRCKHKIASTISPRFTSAREKINNRFWSTYSFVAKPVINRELEEYRNHLTDFCFEQWKSLKPDEDAVPTPHYMHHKNAIAELLRIKFGATGGISAYEKMLLHITGKTIISARDIIDRGVLSSEPNIYRWEPGKEKHGGRFVKTQEPFDGDTVIKWPDEETTEETPQ